MWWWRRCRQHLFKNVYKNRPPLSRITQHTITKTYESISKVSFILMISRIFFLAALGKRKYAAFSTIQRTSHCCGYAMEVGERDGHRAQQPYRLHTMLVKDIGKMQMIMTKNCSFPIIKTLRSVRRPFVEAGNRQISFLFFSSEIHINCFPPISRMFASIWQHSQHWLFFLLVLRQSPRICPN